MPTAQERGLQRMPDGGGGRGSGNRKELCSVRALIMYLSSPFRDSTIPGWTLSVMKRDHRPAVPLWPDHVLVDQVQTAVALQTRQQTLRASAVSRVTVRDATDDGRILLTFHYRKLRSF